MEFYSLYLLLRCAKEFGHGKIKSMGFSDTEHLICTFLLGHDYTSQDDVADTLKLDKTTVAKALLSLEKKGFVKRTVNSQNRRKYALTLTKSGRDNIADIVDVYDAWFREVSACLTPQEQLEFQGYCDRLLAAAEKANKEINEIG
ncbi:MAG: MarR family transcriptional regulator [Clostridiales bacterium]|nr:MarR family transcriptional regulator [Clostridiales bacterium]